MSSPTVHVRTATPSDADAIARVHSASADEAYAPLAAQWPATPWSERVRGWTMRLATPGGPRGPVTNVALVDDKVVGFASAGPARRTDVNATLELYVIHVLARHRADGIGGALWERTCNVVRGDALLAMFVQSFAELRSHSFYQARGGVQTHRTPDALHGGPVTRVVFHWPQGRSHSMAAAAR